MKQISNSWYLLLILAILSLLLGILIILNPFGSIIAISLLAGIFLLMTEIVNLIENIYLIIKLK